MKKRIGFYLWFICSVLLINSLPAQEVIKIVESNQGLESRWESAVQTGTENESFWIGYSVRRLMGEHSFIGSHYEDTNVPTIADIISGKAQNNIEKSKTEVRERFIWNEGKSLEKIMKEVAILFEVSKNGNKDFQIDEVKMSNLELPFKLHDKKLIWLGPAEYNESIEALEHLFNKTGDPEIREDLVSAVGIHDHHSAGFRFLQQIIAGSDLDAIREQAVFWLARHENKEVLPMLKKVALEDRSGDVREKAVFGLYIAGTDAAVDVLIDLAKRGNETNLRAKAMFWLGQTAGQKAVDTIEDAVYNDEETEIQKQAVFALSRLDSEDSVTKLIKVAETHPNPEIRKKAIFWLGQTEDERALEAIIGFIRN